jgi:membrane protease YdiL (CAAX protease family)
MKETAVETPPSPAWILSCPWLFFGLVFCWSWGIWIPTAVSGISVQSALGTALELVGLLGPMLGGIGFAYLTQTKAGWLEYWARIIDPKRIRPEWYPIIFLFAPALWAVAVLLDIASGGSAAPALISKAVTPFLSAPSTIIPFAIATFIYGPIPEELGWRGYVLDRLQARRSALAASLILGAVWAVYHLPLFFMKHSYHYGQGAWSTWFWLFMVQIVAVAVIFTWIFNNTRRSTLAAILFHFMLNLSAELANLTAQTNFYATVLWIITATIIVAIWGAGTLSRREGTPSGRSRFTPKP